MCLIQICLLISILFVSCFTCLLKLEQANRRAAIDVPRVYYHVLQITSTATIESANRCCYHYYHHCRLPLSTTTTIVCYHYYRYRTLRLLVKQKKNKTKTKKTIHGIQKSRKRERMKQKTKIKQSSYKSSCNLARRGTHLKLYV